MLEKTYNIQEILKDDYKYSRVIADLLEKHGWKSTTDNATYSSKNKKSIIKTYLDGTENIFLKHRLAENFGKYYFIPKSYPLETVKDTENIPEVARSTNIWFLKPSSMLIGGSDGIVILKIRKGEAFRETVKNNMKKGLSYVLQRNVEFPMLIDDIKFDLRIFCVVVYTPKEFAAYIINKGNIRFAVKKYKCNSTSKYRLVTNVSVHKNFTPEQIKKTGHQLTDIFISGHHTFVYFPVIKAIFQKIIEQTFDSYDKTSQSYGFIFIGLDVLIDSQGQVYIIEVNQHPTLYDDSSSLETAMNYPYHYGANHYIFKHFYEIVFDGLINNKLVDHDLGSFILTNHYRFSESPIYDKQLLKSHELILYKFNSLQKDVRMLHKFMQDQPFEYINPWGSRYTRSRCSKHISLSETKQNTLLCGLLLNDSEHKLVGLTGIQYISSCEQNAAGFYTHIIIDKNFQGKSLGKKGMLLLIEYIKVSKLFDIKVLYANILISNKKSLKLHKSLGFKEVTTVGYETTLSLSLS